MKKLIFPKKSYLFNYLSLTFFTFSFFFLPGCINFLELFTNKGTDEALFQEIQILIKENQCEKSLPKFEKLSQSFQEEKKTQLLKSKAYACVCGLNFISFILQMSFTHEEEEAENETSFLEFLMKQFKGATSDQIAACITAQELLLSIEEEPQARSIDENLYLSYLSLVTIGVILNHTADTDNNQEVDPSFNACEKEPLSDELTSNIGDSLFYASQSFSHVSESINTEQESIESTPDGETEEEDPRQNIKKDINLIESLCEDLKNTSSSENEVDLCTENKDGNPVLHQSILRIFINESFQIETTEDCIP